MLDDLLPIFAIGAIFIGLPWLIFHYVTQWKKSGSLSLEDENLLDALHDLARRLDDRMTTIERIIAADDPGFRRPHADRIADDRGEDHDLDRMADRQRRR